MAKVGESLSTETKKKISKALKGRAAHNKNIPRNAFEREKISIGTRKIFSWLGDKKLSNFIARDFAIGNLCLKNGLYKPAIILYSGVLEAVLRDALKDKDEVFFVDLINKAGDKDLIGESNKNKLHVLRDFRNYVHIHREAKGEYELTQGIAQLAQETCESVTKELSKLNL